ncbi:MAG: T9SS type A sorting domain-containing protein [Flavobacteriia bacterium]|nr:T9SS type A sorting domain-containing protein [Flavobacteriia bacterium]
MKKILLLSLLSSNLINAQITVTNNDFATGGDTVRMSLSSDTGLDFVQTGSNQTWDFSSLTPSSQVLDTFHSTTQIPFLAQIQFGNFAPTKYKASYFREATTLPLSQLTFLPVTINNVFQYTRLTADSLTSVGYSMVINDNEIPYKSDTIEKNYEFPMQYGNTTFSRGYTKIDMNPVYDAILIQHRVHSSEIDGWGSIITPFGTFNALRVKHEINELDSVQITVFGQTTWIPLQNPLKRDYEWWTNNQNEPILRISTSDFGGNETISNVQYRDFYRDLSAKVPEINKVEIAIFPNPTSDFLEVKTNESIQKIEIIDLLGKNVLVSEVIESGINISHLNKGYYIVNVTTVNGNYKSVFEKL